MGPVLLVALLAIALPRCACTASGWDYIVMHRNLIEFYRENFTISVADVHCFNNLTAMTHDPIDNVLFIANFENGDTTGVYSKSLEAGANNDFVKRTSFPSRIEDMVYDPVTRRLFWSCTNGIYSLYTAPDVEVQNDVLLAYADHAYIRGISMDSCRGTLYWVVSNHDNSSIVSLKIEDQPVKEKIEIVVKDLYFVQDIAIDQVSKKLYWLDESKGAKYTINRANLDGTDQTVLYEGHSHEPIRLSFFNFTLFWTEISTDSIYEYDVRISMPPKLTKTFQIHPKEIIKKFDISNQISNIPDCQNLKDMFRNAKVRTNKSMPLYSNMPFCLNSGVLRNSGEDIILNRKICNCSNEFEGVRCERYKCYNYCINNAQCSVNTDGIPVCRCSAGYNGLRCENLSCGYFCQNNASCENRGKKVICNCTPGFSGDTCEIEITTTTEVATTTIVTALPTTYVDLPLFASHNLTAENVTQISQLAVKSVDSCAVNSSYTLIISIFSCVVCVLIILIAILSYHVMRYSKRPRIIRKIIGKKASVSRSNRPIRNGCEITIEDCCNMNICDTPCFEPNNSFLDDSKKNDKMTLLYNKPFYNDS